MRIRVSDTGAGMDEEALARAFEPYFSTKASGTGLGLPIAKRNVELSGGTITVSERPRPRDDGGDLPLPALLDGSALPCHLARPSRAGSLADDEAGAMRGR